MYKLLKSLSFLLLALFLLLQGGEGFADKKAFLLTVDGGIGPATQEYIFEGIKTATVQNAQMVILKLNTPGGLDNATRGIIRDILSSPIPIVTYVAPQGSRAASAGTYILLASHIAAMAPTTHLGAATPVTLDFMGDAMQKEKQKKPSPEEKKMLSDSIAYIKGLAELRGRNVEWAEKAVTEAASLQAKEALRLGVIDVIASDIPELLKEINGRKVVVQNEEHIIETQGMEVQPLDPDWRLEFLTTITDPRVAYLLLIIGIWGLFFEFLNPGYILPGVAGLISFLVGLYAFQLLPVHYTGLALTIVGILFMAAEFYTPTYGVLGGGGLIAFFIGSILLFDMEGYTTPWTLIMGMTFASAGFLLFVLGFILRSAKRRVVSGMDAMVGEIAIVQANFQDKGWVRVDGEIWKARSKVPLKKGQEVEIVKCKGLELKVRPLSHKGEKDV